jgi:hypothetical protein
MNARMGWFGSLGEAVFEHGSPFGVSLALNSGGSRGAATGEVSGYSIIEAVDLVHAARLACGCPQLSSAGTLAIYEAMPM